jgi:ribosomal protein S24E
VSKDELRGKLGELYKAKKDDVSVFGFKTHFGGGKSTGFALIYDSPEAMKKFEPHYRLVRYGMASKIEKASRQQRTLPHSIQYMLRQRIWLGRGYILTGIQANNARTGRRRSEERPRLRAPRRRTRNKRVHHEGRGGSSPMVWVVRHGRGVAVCKIIVYIYDECLKNSCTGPAGWNGV